ncbi:MAG: hypothetical protein AAF773_27975 [Cyanobacteria bacterium P01_D01_bin.115]
MSVLSARGPLMLVKQTCDLPSTVAYLAQEISVTLSAARQLSKRIQPPLAIAPAWFICCPVP